MKRNTIFVLFALVFISLMMSTAMAQPVKKEVSGTQSGTTVISFQELNDEGIYTQIATGSGTVTINIEGYSSPMILKTTSEITLVINTKTDDGVIHFDMKFAKIVDDTEVGAFEGQVNGHTITYAYAPNGYPIYPAQTESYIHGVLQGTGIYDGQKLALDGTRVIGKALTWEGILSST